MIHGGHRLTDIQGFTLAQCRLYLAALDRAKRAERLARVTDLRAAQASKKDFEAYLKALDDER